MPRGPLPKSQPSRPQDANRRAFQEVELGSSPAGGGPARGGERTVAEWKRLHRRTRLWWKGWLDSPQASQLTGLDWNRLGLTVLPLVEAFHRADDEGDEVALRMLAGELRAQEAKFGGTPDDRQRLRWVTRKPAAEDAPAEPKPKRRSAKGDPRLQAIEGGRGKT